MENVPILTLTCIDLIIFCKCSYFKQFIDFAWATKYVVYEMLGNDVDSLLPRITFVRAREPSRFFLYWILLLSGMNIYF